MGASITRRMTRSGEARFVVRYRLGGRTFPVQHAGSFLTMREARGRRDLVAGEIAAGRSPRILLDQLQAAPQLVEPLILLVDHPQRIPEHGLPLAHSERRHTACRPASAAAGSSSFPRVPWFAYLPLNMGSSGRF